MAAVAYVALTRQHSASTPPVATSKTSTSALSTSAAAHGLLAVKRAERHAEPATRGDPAAAATVGDRWYRLMMSAPDRYTFVKGAAPAALKGDGRAAWLIGDAIADCINEITYAKRGVDSAAQLQQKLEENARVGNPAWLNDYLKAQHERCKTMGTGDAFAGLPAREGGYDHARYWWDLGAQSNDPGAQARGAVEKMVTGNLDEAHAQAAVDRAVQSGDPMALFWVGFALS
ncbi:MAG TPA: hypothetical protein VGN03_04620, partial [Steroidobacteraceae bacterium]